jgi:hypothetical protein
MPNPRPKRLTTALWLFNRGNRRYSWCGSLFREARGLETHRSHVVAKQGPAEQAYIERERERKGERESKRHRERERERKRKRERERERERV